MKRSRYKILLVEDNPGDARLFEEMLSEASTLEFEIQQVQTLSGALEWLLRGGCDLIVLDLGLPDSRGIETFGAVQERGLDVPIIVLTGEHDTSLGLRAVREGAQDYLVKGETSPSTLARSVVYAIERYRQQKEQVQRALSRRPGRVLSFIGAKGGVGTTTVAHNVASVLARERQTVLIELSPGLEALSLYTHARPSSDLRGLLELEASAITTSDVDRNICRLPQGLRVLFCPQGVPMSTDISADHAAVILSRASELAEFVVLDLPRAPMASTRVAVRSSAYVVLVANPEEVSTAAASGTVGLLQSWGLSSALIGVAVVNMGYHLNPLKPSDVGAASGCKLVGAIPPVPAGYQSHNQAGIPVVFGKPDSGAAMALLDLANRLSGDPIRPLEL
jgi:Flp pilus assembly CpaE family ATPase